MKIMYVSTEVAPYSKAGGLGDVLAALPVKIEKMSNLCCIFTPLYGCIDCEKYNIKTIPDSTLKLKFGTGEFVFNLRMTQIPNSNINIFFLESKKYYSSFKEIYPKELNTRYEHERYIVFTRAVLEYTKLLNFRPDVIHLNDWHSTPIVAYLRTLYKNDEFYKKTKVIFSIHNLAYQGNYSDDILDFAQLPKSLISQKTATNINMVNWMKTGIDLCDCLLTVSPQYAEEITTANFGCGLENTIKKKKKTLKGILNGVDYKIFNPETDTALISNYNITSLDNKSISKEEMLKHFKLKGKEKPLIVFISRLVEQKGLDLIIKSAERLKKLDANFAILGSGDIKYEKYFLELNGRAENIKTCTKYTERLAHKLYAGGDILLMPSRFEPCGISQMIALKYGTIPIVRATGGLENTVIGYPLNGANGFKFWDYNCEDLIKCIEIALRVYQNKKIFNTLIKNAMLTDFSWEKSAKQYFDIYEHCKKMN